VAYQTAERNFARILARAGSPDFLFAYRVTLGPTAMKILAKKTGLRREDL
jgi:hypothetical protein